MAGTTIGTIAQISGSVRSATVTNSRNSTWPRRVMTSSRPTLFRSARNSVCLSKYGWKFCGRSHGRTDCFNNTRRRTGPNSVAIDTSTVLRSWRTPVPIRYHDRPGAFQSTYLQKIGNPISVGTAPTSVAVDNLRHLALTVSIPARLQASRLWTSRPRP